MQSTPLSLSPQGSLYIFLNAMNFTDLIYKVETISSADGLLSADVFQHCFIRSSMHWQFGSTLYSWKYRKDISNFKKWKILLQTEITIKRLTWTCIDHILKNIFKPFLILAFIKCYCSDHKQEAHMSWYCSPPKEYI